MRHLLLWWFGMIGASWAFAQPVSERITRLEERCRTILIKDDTLLHQLSIDTLGISIFADPATKLKDSAEFQLKWGDVEAFNAWTRQLPYDTLRVWYLNGELQRRISAGGFVAEKKTIDKARPLAGMRIAIDPGHVGGTMEMGMMEWKYIQIKADSIQGIGEDIAFNEGNLALATALLLDSMFRAAGADVLLTRSKEGHTAFGCDFQTWLDQQQKAWEQRSGWRYQGSRSDLKAKERYQIRCAANMYMDAYPENKKDSLWWMNKSSMVSVYKGPFLRSEFEQRARLVHDFKPDLTLIIHYNVLETNEPSANGYRSAVNENFSMAFVPGSFMKGELGRPEDRLDFLVKLLSEDLDASVALCNKVLDQHEWRLGVPRLKLGAHLGYIVNASKPMKDAPGVYARNLALTRKIHGVLCFGESLYQDNVDECVRLNQKDFVLPGMSTPSPTRVREVADAYFKGVMEWVMTAND